MNILALLADRISMPPKKKNLTNLHDKLFNGLAPKIFIIRLASGSPDKKYFIGACPLNYINLLLKVVQLKKCSSKFSK